MEETLGQQNQADAPDGETVGSPEVQKARLEEPLEDEQEKIGEDDASRISSEESMMTKNPGNPPHLPVLPAGRKRGSRCSVP